MNTPVSATSVHPDVANFLTAVRTRLDDLSADDREELLAGLEADLADQYADGAPLPMGDPATYAYELRAAAGLPPRTRFALTTSRKAALLTTPTAFLDGCRSRWKALIGHDSRADGVWSFVASLRPAWWVLRAWLLVTLLDIRLGGPELVTLIPELVLPGAGLLALLGAIALSALIGSGSLWPGAGPDRPVRARLVTLAINVVAIATPVAIQATFDNYLYPVSDYGAGYRDGLRENRGLDVNGKPVRNIFAYDAAGQPLTGVQLFDQSGRPLSVSTKDAVTGRREERRVGCPSYNGSIALYNVYPLATRDQPRGTCLSVTGDVGSIVAAIPPLAQVPPVKLPVAQPAAPTSPEGAERPDPNDRR